MANRSLNKVMLIGHLGKDPELSYTPSGIAIAKFTMATNEQWKDENGNTQERTEWHNIIAWRKLADICNQYLKKGSKIYLEGRLQTRSWEDKNTGIKRYVTEIIADDMIMLDPKGTLTTTPEDIQSIPEEPEESGKDDLPF